MYHLFAKHANEAIVAQLNLNKTQTDYAQRRDELQQTFLYAQASANALALVLDKKPMTEEDFRYLMSYCG